jgi:hypothetical protein
MQTINEFETIFLNYKYYKYYNYKCIFKNKKCIHLNIFLNFVNLNLTQLEIKFCFSEKILCERIFDMIQLIFFKHENQFFMYCITSNKIRQKTREYLIDRLKKILQREKSRTRLTTCFATFIKNNSILNIICHFRDTFKVFNK